MLVMLVMLALQLDGPVMAAIALSLFWIHIVLIAAAALADLRVLARLRRRLATCERTEVRSARGPEGLLARNWVEQLGRLDRRGGPRAIHFHDRAHHSELFGGRLVLADGRELELVPTSAGDVEVWPELATRAEQAGRFDAETFERAQGQAGKAKGFERIVETRIAVGDRVWVVGRIAGSRIEADPTLILATHDPRPWLARSRRLAIGFVILDVLVAGLCTLLALWPPHFEWISMLGAAGALGWFLAVQPLGVAVHDALRTPDRSFLRGSWREA
ncbi:hypothetical protein ACNOYE_34525 [Nannocystaceae bacterium ST9]